MTITSTAGSSMISEMQFAASLEHVMDNNFAGLINEDDSLKPCPGIA